MKETRDGGRKCLKAEGLFNKNTSERVSSNLGHRSLDGWPGAFGEGIGVAGAIADGGAMARK